MKPRAYYNEFDPKAAAWLRELINRGLIASGDVDERSIVDVRPDDLNGYTQCHFFAGIGGWSYALRLAGWPDDRPVWTGSCPCQPFSSAGKKTGHEDDRHLWPTWFRIIRECRPDTIFGEQVARAIGYGWLDGVSTDLESEAYAIGSTVLGAHSVGAPHIRPRVYWVANSLNERLEERQEQPVSKELSPTQRGSHAFGVGDTVRTAKERFGSDNNEVLSVKAANELGDTGFWLNNDPVYCRDGCVRRTQSGILPMVDGLPARVVRIRGYGNAIVPQVAATFIQASVEAIADARLRGVA